MQTQRTGAVGRGPTIRLLNIRLGFLSQLGLLLSVPFQERFHMLRHWGANRAMRTTEHKARNACPRGSRCGWRGGPWACLRLTPISWEGIAPLLGSSKGNRAMANAQLGLRSTQPSSDVVCVVVCGNVSGPCDPGRYWGPAEHCQPESWLCSC